MAINSDRDGFLLPDERLSADTLAQGIQGIQQNTDAILALLRANMQAMERQANSANPNAPGGPGGPGPSQGQAQGGSAGQAGGLPSVPVPDGSGSRDEAARNAPRDSQGRFVRDPGADVAGEVRQLTRQQAQQAAEEQRAEESRRTREGTDQQRDARGRFGSGGGAGGDQGDKDEKKGFFGRMKEFFKGRDGGIGDAEKVDPAIESAKEVLGMVGGAFGAMKTTYELGKAVTGRGVGGPPKDRETPWFKRLLQQLKLMRRDDTQFHRAELRALNEQRGGGGGGNIITDLLKLVFSPIGMALIAALAGVWMALGDKIMGAWNGFVDGIKAKWDAAVEKFMGIWEPIAKFFSDKFGIVTDAAGAAANKVNEVVKDATGVDMKAGLQKAGEAVTSAKDKSAEGVGSLLGKLDKGYRHKATFDGIKGGEQLTRDGRYTNDEAEKIRSLKKGRANTSGGLPGGMPERIRNRIIANARAEGVDPEMMLKFAQMESKGNPNAISETGAIGLYQITGGTATGLGVKDRFDENENIAGGVKLAKESARMLTTGKNKLPATPENIYLMHMLGPVAKEVILAAQQGKSVSELSPEARAGISKNRGRNAKTAAEFVGINAAAYRNQELPKGAAEILAAGKPSATPPAAAGAAPLVLGADKVANMGIAAAPAATAPGSAAVPTPVMAGAAPAPGIVTTPPRVPAIKVPAKAPPGPAPRSDAPVPLSSKTPIEVTVRNSDKMAGQDLNDRRLAHIATGGMSG